MRPRRGHTEEIPRLFGYLLVSFHQKTVTLILSTCKASFNLDDDLQAARKRKVKGRDQPAAEDSQIAASTKKTNKKQEANALGKAPSSSKKVGTQLAEADSAKLSSDSSASLEEPAASSGAADQDEAGEFCTRHA